MRVHVADHPLITHKLTVLRDKNTPSPTFRALTEELMTLLAYEATRNVRTDAVEIETPVAKTTGLAISMPIPLVVPILRAGLGMLEGMVKLVPTADGRMQLHGVCWNGQDQAFDLVYSALGTSANADLAAALNCRLAEDGRLEVDLHQKTSIPGFYAAGDIVRGLNQIAVATAEAAVAATAIHNSLRQADGQTV